MATQWLKGIAQWDQEGALCLSVPFTWLLPEARAIALSNPTRRVVVGGPAVRLMPGYLADCGAEIETLVPDREPLSLHNPDATRTTVGCDNGCEFCAVSRVEGEFRELTDWRPAPIVCDSNLLQCSIAHLRTVCERLAGIKGVDFNQGLEARRLTAERIDLLRGLSLAAIRMAWDGPRDETDLMAALERLDAAGFPRRKVSVYCLVGWRETPDDALERLETVRAAGLTGYAMRYQPLDALTRNAYCPPQWDRQRLADFCRYWNKQTWLAGVTWAEYCAWSASGHYGVADERQPALAL